jgi:GNAT superfamily N-acetyltransferase
MASSDTQTRPHETSPAESLAPEALAFHPVTTERWADLEALFSERGACANCWCMFWRLERTILKQLRGPGNKEQMRGLLEAGEVPGLLAYADGKAVAWCSIGPRDAFRGLDNSRLLRRIDETPVWAVTCFYVARPFRRRGVMLPLLRAALAYAAAEGAEIVEGYPVDLDERLTGFGGYMGIASVFRRAGFEEVRRASPTQPIMRYRVEGRGSRVGDQ